MIFYLRTHHTGLMKANMLNIPSSLRTYIWCCPWNCDHERTTSTACMCTAGGRWNEPALLLQLLSFKDVSMHTWKESRKREKLDKILTQEGDRERKTVVESFWQTERWERQTGEEEWGLECDGGGTDGGTRRRAEEERRRAIISQRLQLMICMSCQVLGD